MSYSTLQKDLERITLKKDLDQALERMVDFEEEVNRNKEEEEEESESESEEEEEEEEEDLECTYSYTQIVKSYFIGLALGVSLVGLFSNINGRSKNNQRRES